MRGFLLAVMAWSSLMASIASADVSVPASAKQACGGPEWPALRHAVDRYCATKIYGHEDPSGMLEIWCDDARAQMAGCPDRWTWSDELEPGILTLKLGGTCSGYWIHFKRARRWTVISLVSSAEDPC
jgi:hypothetical protein